MVAFLRPDCNLAGQPLIVSELDSLLKQKLEALAALHRRELELAVDIIRKRDLQLLMLAVSLKCQRNCKRVAFDQKADRDADRQSIYHRDWRLDRN